MIQLDHRLISYMYYFNIKQDYYECHEYGESLWLDSGRPIVLKGLIQAAVCLYHLHNGNVTGGWRMWQRARKYLAPYRPYYECLDIDALTEANDRVFAKVPEEWRTKTVTPEDIRGLKLPTVHLTITDPEIETALASWVPPSLHHDA